MATCCDVCGARTNEVKSGAGIAEKGVRISLRITDPIDMSRDILKSETCSLSIPDLDFEVGAGTLGGKFTTLEGLLTSMKEQLTGSNPLVSGDSVTSTVKGTLYNQYRKLAFSFISEHLFYSCTKERMDMFNSKLDDIITGKTLGTVIILNDPAGNSYLQNVYAPDLDPEMEIVHYERTYEDNEELGINDMRLENYEEEVDE